MFFRWRWIFPSRWLSAVKPAFDSSWIRQVPGEIFSLFFPADCRICSTRLRNISRIPVCPSCLRDPQPFVAEYFCESCRTPFLNPQPLDAEGRCALCRNGLTQFDSCFAFGEYEGALRGLIHLFKYDGVQPLASPLGAMLAGAMPREMRFDVIVPVPLHWRRQWSRGFNQTELLAKELQRRTRLPFAAALRRGKVVGSQAGLTRAQRRKNVSGVFEVRRSDAVAGKHVLLIDDVLTTGATVNACAQVLKRSGARRVTVLTLARVDRRKSFAAATA